MNRNINNFVSSRKNLESKDSKGFYHKWLLVVSFYTGKNNQLLHKAALDISRKEQSLRVSVDQISSQRFTSLEAGVYYPSGSTQMSIGLDRSNKITQLALNKFLHGSERFQAELDQIGRCEHRIQGPLPNPSQSYAISQYAYTAVKHNLWPDTSSEHLTKLKIYDHRFRWKVSSSGSIGDLNQLPPWHVLISYVADEFPVSDIISSPSREINKQTLEKWNNKCLFECRNLLHVPVDNQQQQTNFRTQEFQLGNEEFEQLNTERKPAFRASDQINSLCEIEIDLKPTSHTLTKFRTHHNLRGTTAYQGRT